MARNITVKIAGKDFPLVAADDDAESIMRLAAEEVGELLAKYEPKMPGRSLEDKLSLVALGEAVRRLQIASKLSSVMDEAGALKGEIEKYLEGK